MQGAKSVRLFLLDLHCIQLIIVSSSAGLVLHEMYLQVASTKPGVHRTMESYRAAKSVKPFQKEQSDQKLTVPLDTAS